MYEFQINASMQQKIIRQENKKHLSFYLPWVMIVVAVIAFILMKNYFSTIMVPAVMDHDHIWGTKFCVIMMSSLFTLLLYIIPVVCTQRYLSLLGDYKNIERLTITEDAIENTYNPIWESESFSMRRVRIVCREITRLEWYPNHSCLKIYAPVSITNYLTGTPSNPNIIEKERLFTGKNSFRVFYAYYDDFDKFIQQVQRLSGKSVIECTDRTKLREKK